jgi:iron complex outermembrane receptor protein
MAIFNRTARLQLLAAAALGAMATAAPAYAQERPKQAYDMAAQDLATALRTVGRQSGQEIVFPSDALDGRRAPRLRGSFTPQEAVRALLAGTDLVVEFKGDAILIRGRSEAPGAVADRPAEPRDIIVTGSRLRGTQSPSPVISISKSDMLAAGQNSLADVVASVPQNFGGGQNPGIGLNVPGSNNISGASTINLRGLGGDATLTLLDGHRLSYGAQRQSIDISAIPFAAVDRIEIVADGASALYGSDAVAGVANIILKHDFSGLSTTARWGASTDGGNAQLAFGGIAGGSWRSGGVYAALDVERDTPIVARQRSYTASRSPGLTLYPYLRHYNGLISAHQALGPNLTFEVDAFYNNRRTDSFYALDATGNPLANGGRVYSNSESFAIAPALKLSLPGDWRMALSGMYGEDRTNYGAVGYAAGAIIFPTYICYCNKANSVELSGDGTLLALPAGPAKIAIGAGYRSNDFHETNLKIRASQNTYYAYGELNLPLVGPDQHVPLIDRLSVSGAGRYEAYPGIDRVLTPKLGLIYAPTPDFEIKASWGRSFRAPTLFQQYVALNVTVQRAAARGGVGYPSTATVLQLTGGNPGLKPERARTWSASLALHPRALPGARLEISYFNVSYRDRIVAPITFIAQALNNPIYRDLVNFTPSAADKANAIASGNFINNLGRPYDAGDVVAIIDNRNLNAAAQTIHGVDVSARYRADLAAGRSLTLSANASFLDSAQQLSALQPFSPLAGQLFNPPHFRGRAGVVLNDGDLTLSSFVDHIGGVTDARAAPSVHVGSMTTADLSARYTIAHGPSPLRGTEISLSISNIFNAAPDILASRQVYEQPYDSSNYSPVGRFISFGITKRW